MDIVTAITECAKDHKRASSRLRAAAVAIAEQVQGWLEEAGLHRCGDFTYHNQQWRGQITSSTWTYWREVCLDGSGKLFMGDFNCPCPDAPTSHELIAFAKSVQGGVLDSLRAELAKKIIAIDAAANALESAI